MNCENCGAVGKKRMKDFHPSVKACSLRGCNKLVRVRFEGRDRRVCQLTDRIPGNLSECPKEEGQ